MSTELMNVVSSWLSIVIPPVGAIVDTASYIQSFSDKLLFEKLYFILSQQDSDFEEWLKLSEKFEEDSKDYNKMVRQLVYYINAINEVDLLQAYANLLKAYKCCQICKQDFFRLGFCLSKLLSEDAQYLSRNIGKEKIAEDLFCISLSSNNLMYNISRGFSTISGDAEKDYYCFTEVGKMLDKYALCYGDESKYSYKTKDAQLSKQKLTHEYIRSIEGVAI